MKNFLIVLFFTIVSTNLCSQDMLGIRSSNFAGIQSLGINPALIQNSRLNVDVNLIGAGATIENDFLYIPKSKLKFFGIQNVMKKFDEKEYLDEFEMGDPDKLYNASAAITVMGPGVLFTIKNKHAIALTSQFRSGVSVQNLQGHAAKFAVEGFTYDPLHSQLFLGKDFELNILNWIEYGISYATTIFQNDKGALTGGVNIKQLRGVAGAYAKNANMYYNVLNDSDMVFGQFNFSEIDYGRTDYNSFDDINRYRDIINGAGWGFDIGFTYDFLKDPALWKYEMDGEKHIDHTANRYKLRLGASLLDFGKIKFSRNSATYHLETDFGFYENWNTDEFDDNIDFDMSMSGIFYNQDSLASYRSNSFKMGLPVALSFQADWNAYKNFYVNGVYIHGFNQKETGVDRPSVLALTPRFETKWIDVSVPISYYNYTGKISRVGLAIRFASFFIGSDRVGTLFGLGDMNGMDVYAGLKISFYKTRIRDMDGDGVSDKRDKCKEIAGLLKFDGCPDRDGDDVPDAIDKCPDVPGLVSLQGCPDRDGDGITDAEDECPDEAGLPQFNGCPDTDGDGIRDSEDDCPTVAGLAIFNGCPDTDGDGIPDPLDDCPTTAGLPEFNGCPDTDGDGIPDNIDECPYDVGPVSNKGCPVKITQAPVIVETVVTQLTAEEQEIINKVFSNLQFETGKAVIKESSYSSLDDLAGLMIKKPTFKLKIEGYTDNTGSAQVNKTISEKRANAAKNYLIGKGVESFRITARGFGKEKPLATNATSDGRAKNRRVEFQIIE